MLLFWIVSALLSVMVVVALTRPLVRSPRAAAASDGPSDHADLDVYRDQLTELEADKARGLISPADAEAARVEVARRLLHRAAEIDHSAVAAPPVGIKQQQRLFYVVATAVPGLALLLYLGLGAPHLPDQPIAQRIAQSERGNQELDAMITRVESRLRENPGEGQGWDVLAPVYLRMERLTEATEAFQRAIDILGPTPRRLGGLAEAIVLANNGVVTERARRAYEKLLELAPGQPEARFGLALAKEQDGELAQAESDYRALLAETPDNAQWREFIVARLDAIAERRGKAKSDSGAIAPPVRPCYDCSPNPPTRRAGPSSRVSATRPRWRTSVW